MRRKFVITMCCLLLICGFVFSGNSSAESVPLTIENIFQNNGSVMLIINSVSGEIIDANHAAAEFYGYTIETLREMKIQQINALSPGEIQVEMSRALAQERNYFNFEHRLSDGSIRHVEVYSYPFTNEISDSLLLSTVYDITPRLLAEQRATQNRIMIYILAGALIVSFAFAYFSVRDAHNKTKKVNERIQNLFENMNEGFAVHEVICDSAGIPVDYVFLEVNKAFESITGLKSEDIKNKRVLEVLPGTEKYWIEKYGNVALNGVRDQFVNYSSALDKYFSVSVYRPALNQFATLFTDVSEMKRNEARILFLSYHDQLTGLYNRRFFEEETIRLNTARNLPLTLAVCDVNGLKLTNDAFGHLAGDALLKRISEILKAECRADDIIARIGGDEFAIIFPNTDVTDAEHIVARIYEATQNNTLNHFVLSLSIGWCTKTDMKQSMEDVFICAEEMMYRRKLTESQSMRNQTIKTILNTLYAQNPREQQHAERVSKIAIEIGRSMHLDYNALKNLETAALMHDIGKIILDTGLLTKSGDLTEKEYEEIKRHPECSYQILKSVDQYSDLADYVLSHHEHWDGNGYPRGLSKDEIPLISRIITIADAFDAMTTDRPYRKAMNARDAVDEIMKCSGSHFDPNLVKLFITMNTDAWETT